MKVTLNQEEIFTALENHILENVRVGDNIRLDMDLAATRGAEGYTATITFVDVSDEAADPKDAVVPTEESQGLSIVDKINEAKAKAPRRSPPKLPGFRQGTHAGQPIKIESASKSVAKGEDKTDEPDLPFDKNEPTENSEDVVVKHEAPKPVEAPEAPTEVDTAEQVVTESEDHEVAEPNAETQAAMQQIQEGKAEKTGTVENTMETLNAEESAQEPQEEAQPVEATETKPRKRSLFGDTSPAPQDEAALAAEAAATEPQEEDVDYTPTPETKGLESEDAGDPVEDEKPKTRSLFGNLTKPNNG